jgi:L-ribulokinase
VGICDLLQIRYTGQLRRQSLPYYDTVLVDPGLARITFGWNLLHTAEDELFAGIEGTAFHSRIIQEHMEQYGVQVACVTNAGGIS